MAKFPAASYASTLPKGERDRFAAIALRARDPLQAITAYQRQSRKGR